MFRPTHISKEDGYRRLEWSSKTKQVRWEGTNNSPFGEYEKEHLENNGWELIPIKPLSMENK